MNTASALASRPEVDPVRQSRDLVAQIRSSELYRSYEEAFQATTGLPLALHPIGALQSPFQGCRNVNRFCSLLMASNSGCAACLRMQQQTEESATAAGGTGTCYAGLAESAVPIRAGGRVVAYLRTGQVLTRRATLAQFERTMRKLNAWGATAKDREALREAYFSTPVVAPGRFEASVRLLAIFAEHLSSLTSQLLVKQAAAELPAVSKARAYIAEHQAEEVSLGDVARAVNMSVYYFCKTFKRVTGTTFIDYLARLRIENVKRLLLDPHKRISEAAFEVGFQSLSQFNRAFRRIAGEAPTEYRARLHGSAFPLLAAPVAAAA